MAKAFHMANTPKIIGTANAVLMAVKGLGGLFKNCSNRSGLMKVIKSCQCRPYLLASNTNHLLLKENEEIIFRLHQKSL
jgi:hypothetical protein